MQVEQPCWVVNGNATSSSGRNVELFSLCFYFLVYLLLDSILLLRSATETPEVLVLTKLPVCPGVDTKTL